ncbi:MAG: RdgB/HAM1 family non-canonical purine NTP pyrophosphatase [Opitutaceae bacterium]|nr:RdgB/HAM1 family non-canonical purine NTP pyrophosphatase [Cytophagales bacterium]
MKLCFATQNINKLKEIQALLPAGIDLITPQEFGCTDELPETSHTLEGNSKQKAEFIYKNYKVDCFADDTGLEILALKGAPGVSSAIYSGTRKAEDNMALVLKNLNGEVMRNARFRTVITLYLNGKSETFEGVLEGSILHDKRGESGFGYDPIFVPHGQTKTLAEMSLAEKSQISHRANAFAKLKNYLEALS